MTGGSESEHLHGFASLILEGLQEDYEPEGVRAIATLTVSGDFDPAAFARKYEAGLENTRELYADTQPESDRAVIESISVEAAFRRALELSDRLLE